MIIVNGLDQTIRYLIFFFALSAGISRGGLNITVSLLTVAIIVRYFIKPFHIEIESRLALALKALLCSMVLSFAFSSNHIASLEFIAWTLFKMLPFLYVVVFINDKRDIRLITLLLALSLLAGSFVAIWQGSHGMVRAKSFLGVMDFAGAIGLIIPVALVKGFEFNGYRNWTNCVYIFTVFVASAASIYNQTRAIWITTVVSIVTYMVLSYSENKKTTMALIILLICIFVVGIYSPNFIDRLHSISDDQMSSNAKRIVMWKYGMDVFLQHPVLGIGIGTFPAYTFEGLRLVPEQGNIYGGHVHNNFIQMLAENGMVGFFAFCFLFGTILCRAIKNLRKSKVRIWALILLLATVDFLVHGLFDYTFKLSTIMYTYWFIVGLCYRNMLEV